MATLYELTAEMNALMESEEVTEEALQAAFGNIQLKAQGLCQFITVVQSNIEVFKAEEVRISDRRKSMENLVKNLKEYAKVNMEALGIPEIKAGTFTLKLQNNSQPALIAENESETPNAYFDIIPEAKEIARERIKADLTAGQPVPGWRLERGKHVRIK